MVSSLLTLSELLKAMPTSEPRSTSCGVPCAWSPSPSPSCSFPRRRASAWSRSIVCWKRPPLVHLPNGYHILLSQRKWVLRIRAAMSRLCRPKPMRSLSSRFWVSDLWFVSLIGSRVDIDPAVRRLIMLIKIPLNSRYKENNEKIKSAA